ncbi:hypothetical protein OWV82_011370 [Melia azedarach]|uniref:Uncharacterized protein n=1 Tax=Melia azedarach TaxID=155640 RepID=A0ACC1Y068_MELAZ|nr:hypothetical protein OWV82_011370 [Melia azedarach]
MQRRRTRRSPPLKASSPPLQLAFSADSLAATSTASPLRSADLKMLFTISCKSLLEQRELENSSDTEKKSEDVDVFSGETTKK